MSPAVSPLTKLLLQGTSVIRSRSRGVGRIFILSVHQRKFLVGGM